MLGITAYGFLVLAARQLGPVDYAPLAALWALVFATVPSVFNPLEQQVARLTSGAADVTITEVRRQGLRAAGVLVLLGLVGVAVTWPFLGAALDHNRLLLLGLALSVVGFAATHLLRGLLLGAGHLELYGTSMALEGVLRLVAAGVLVAAAVSTAGPFGLALGAAPLVATVVLLPLCRRGFRSAAAAPARPAALAPFVRTLLPLIVASVASLSLINAGPLVVKLLADSTQARAASALLAGLALTRLPLFAFPTLQALLLPRFTHLLAAHDTGAVRGLVRRVVTLHLAATVIGTALVTLAGGLCLRILFGEGFVLARQDLLLLSVGTAGHLLALLLGLLLIAAGRGAALAAAWLLAVLAAALTVAAVGGLLFRVELGLVVGAGTAVALIAAVALSPRRLTPDAAPDLALVQP